MSASETKSIVGHHVSCDPNQALSILWRVGGIAAVDRQLTLPPSMRLRKRRGSEMARLWKIPWARRQRLRFRRPLQILASPVFARYITFVIKTSTVVADPPDFVDRARNLHPSIIALWHGQFFLLPGMYPPEIPGRAVVARHDDAEALARVLRKFGLGLIRGAGAAGRRRDRGGAEAAHGAVASLREGFSVP